MMSPRRFAGAALAGLAVVLAGCSSTPAADGASTATVTATPSTPDGVAGAFAAAYAAGDTPTACTFAGGYALQHMTELGQCAHPGGMPGVGQQLIHQQGDQSHRQG